MSTDNTQFCRGFRGWRRKVRERSSTFSLRSTELKWSSHIGPDLTSEYSSRATRGHRNQEFSSMIQAKSFEGRGFLAFESSGGLVFAPRGREPSYLGLFSI